MQAEPQPAATADGWTEADLEHIVELARVDRYTTDYLERLLPRLNLDARRLLSLHVGDHARALLELLKQPGLRAVVQSGGIEPGEEEEKEAS